MMKTRYKHIHFVDSLDDDNHDSYLCYGNNADVLLGRVEYYPRWRQYVFATVVSDIVFSKSCLGDLVDFIKQLKP